MPCAPPCAAPAAVRQPGGLRAPAAPGGGCRGGAWVSALRRDAAAPGGCPAAAPAPTAAPWRCAALAGSTSSSSSGSYVQTSSLDEADWEEAYGLSPLK